MAYSLRSIIKGSTIYTVGQVLARAIGFLLIPVYTRFLTPDDYGIIGILNVIVVLMTAVLSIGMYQAQTRFYYELHDDRRKVGELLFTINVLLVVVTVVACVILTLFGRPLFQVIIKSPDITFYPFIALTIWTAFFNIFNQLMPQYYVATKQYAHCATLWFIQFALSAGFIVFFVVIREEGALGSVKGVLAANVAFFLFFYRSYAKNFVWRFNTQYLRDVLLLGSPIIIHATATALMGSVDKLILEKFLPLSDVGLYTLGYKFGVIMSILVLSINRAWTPNYYELMNQKDTDRAYELRRAFCVWIAAIGAMCIMGSNWSRELIELLTTEQYFGAAGVIPLILLGYFFQGVYVFMVAPLFYFKKTLLVPVLTVGGAILNIGLNIFLIPRIGIMGAAVATVLSFFVLAVAAYFVGRRFFDARYEVIRLSILILAVSAACIGVRFQDPGWLVKAALLPGYLLLCWALFPGYLKPLARQVVSYGGRG